MLCWKVLIKCADLGHCCKPWKLHRLWAFRIMEEMYRQGEAERHLGNETIFEAMDRTKLHRAARSQVGFLEVLAAPMFESWSEFTGNETPYAALRLNVNQWNEIDASGASTIAVSSLETRSSRGSG